MPTRLGLAAALSIAMVGLAGCSTGPAETAPTAPSGPALSTASTSLGTIVVDGAGMTVYSFDLDVKDSGSSSCTGTCSANWPAVTTVGTPSADGVTGSVDTITGVDGSPQVTLDGMPLYTYVGDQKAGDVTGQGVGEVWWAASPSGAKIGG
ncbi:MAG: hypothetical protein H7146_14005 [Burkholderiaceae bacterium]|nr:hypothetical protein [Microbacteriaceae bacterium]